MRLFSNTASPYVPIFQYAPIFEQPLHVPPVTFPIGAYFPTPMKCKPHMRLFFMGTHYWVWAYFPRNTVAENGKPSVICQKVTHPILSSHSLYDKARVTGKCNIVSNHPLESPVWKVVWDVQNDCFFCGQLWHGGIHGPRALSIEI